MARPAGWPVLHGRGQRPGAERTPSSAMPSHSGWYAGQVRLDLVGQRVHPGGRGHRRRQPPASAPDRRTRPGQQPRREHDLLHVGGVGDDRADRPTSVPVPPSSARRRRTGFPCRSAAPPACPPRTPHVAGVDRHQRDDLGHVERRPAAEADDGVGAVRVVGRLPRGYLRLSGCPARREDAGVEPGVEVPTKCLTTGRAASPLSVTIRGRCSPRSCSCRRPGRWPPARSGWWSERRTGKSSWCVRRLQEVRPGAVLARLRFR